MKKLLITSLLLLSTYSAYTVASTVNVISSNGDFAGNSATGLTSLALLTDAKISENLSDNDAGTYLFGSTTYGATTAALTISFQNTVYNQIGNDIAFFFMGGSSDINSMHICFTNNCNPTDTAAYTATIIEDLGTILGDGNIYALSVVTLNLSDFGFASDAALGQFTIDIIAGGYNRLSGIESLNTVAAVPVPAAIWLFLSGIGFLSVFNKRKDK